MTKRWCSLVFGWQYWVIFLLLCFPCLILLAYWLL
jgi:hypothetical protein